jgi:hypothetical protein
LIWLLHGRLANPQHDPLICPTDRFFALSEIASSPRRKNISLYQKPKSPLWCFPSRATQRGVSRSSRTWVRDAMAVGSCQTSKAFADGEIVRSRSPDAGIKPCGTFRKATVARQPGAPRRSRISRNTIAQGTPVVPAALSLLACVRMHIPLHARLAGAACIRCSLRPLTSEGHERCITRAFRAARRRCHTLRCHAPA